MTQTAQRFLVFGGIGGIGGSLASRLHQGGNQVYVTTTDSSKADPQSLSGIPLNQVLTADVLSTESVIEAVATAGQDGLNGLAYCVGTIDLKPLARTTPEDLLRSFQINTIGAFLAIKAAAPMLSKTHGAVVLFSSIAASRGFANHSAIGAAKASVEGLARSLAAELAPHVRVNVIAPSLTETPLARPLTSNPKMSEAIGAMHPIPRLGHADEMADLAAYLLSDRSGWITGQVFHVDGGRSTLEKTR